LSYGVNQAYLPIGYYGTYVFNLLPQRVTFDQSDNIATHNQAGQQDQPENMGWTAQSIDMAGFIASTTTRAITDLYNFTGNPSGYSGRPIAIGLLNQDQANPATWFSGVGFSTMRHVEYLGGLSMYKYPFHFQFQTVQCDVIPCANRGDNTNFFFQFPVADQTTGYIVGVQISGLSAHSLLPLQSLTFSDQTTSTQLGSGATFNMLQTYNLSTPLDWPLIDNNNKQSIQFSTAPNGTDIYNISFTFPWTGLIPSVSVLYLRQ